MLLVKTLVKMSLRFVLGVDLKNISSLKDKKLLV